MDVHFLNDAEGIAGDWRGLADRTGAHPFIRPEWVGAWWEAFGGAGRLRVLVVRDGAVLRALMPLVWHRGVARFPANDHTPMASMLADGPASRALLADGLMRLAPTALRVPGLDAAGRSLEALVGAAGRHRYRVRVRPASDGPYVDLDGVADPLELLSAKRAKELRRLHRRLADHGNLVAGVHTAQDGLDRVLDDALDTEARQWKGEAGTAMRSSGRLEAFYRRVCHDAAADGALRLVWLRLDGRMVAFGICIRRGDVTYALKTGHDPRFARYSPGHLLIAEELRQALADGGGRYEFLGGPDPFKLAWTAQRHAQVVLHATRPGVRGAMVHAAHRIGAPARRAVRAISGRRPARTR